MRILFALTVAAPLIVGSAELAAQTRSAPAPAPIDAFGERIERVLPSLAAELLSPEDVSLVFQALRSQIKAAQTGQQTAAPISPELERRMKLKADRVKAEVLPLIDEMLGVMESEMVGFSRELKRESEKRR
jgi:hypothetical protein